MNKKRAWNRIDLDKTEIKRLYLEERKSAREIAEIMKVGIGIIYRYLKEMEITRNYSECMLEYMKGKRPYNFRGWYIEKRTGYKIVMIPKESPFSSMAFILTKSKALYIREHRLVMAKNLGRALKPWEVVHHINHNKLDNRIENLELIAGQAWHNGETIVFNELNKMEKRIMELETENEKLKHDLAGRRAALLATTD